MASKQPGMTMHRGGASAAASDSRARRRAAGVAAGVAAWASAVRGAVTVTGESLQRERSRYALRGRARRGRAPARRSGEGAGAPGGTRTHDLQVRNLTLYPLSYGRTRRVGGDSDGGEGGIRTLEAGYPTWRFSKPLH